MVEVWWKLYKEIVISFIRNPQTLLHWTMPNWNFPKLILMKAHNFHIKGENGKRKLDDEILGLKIYFYSLFTVYALTVNSNL